MVQETYSKYNTSAFGSASMSIARWQIVVNGQDVVQSSYLTNTITPTIMSSDHVKEGVMAPRSVAYFDLVLDYSKVDTSFEYNIVTTVPQAEAVSDLKVTGYSENGGSIVPVNGAISNLTGTVLLTETQRTKTIRIYTTWEDSVTETMDNAADTDASLTNKKAVINVLINFKQLAN